MKLLKISSLTLACAALVAFVTMSFTNPTMETTVKTVDLDAPPVFTCCPPGWALAYLFVNDPAEFYDNNGDGLICWKFSAIGTGTPLGQGNDPAYYQSNVKDNNNRCPY